MTKNLSGISRIYFQKNMYVLYINKAITEKMPNKKYLMLDKLDRIGLN